MNDHLKWMSRLVKEAKKAAGMGEAPIAAIVVCGDQILSLGRNTKTSDQSGIGHAELNALLQARPKLGRRPENAVLYSTLEPCAMCLGAIVFSGIQTLVYGASDPEGGAVGMFRGDPTYSRWTPEVLSGVMQRECEALRNLAPFKGTPKS